MLRFLLISCLLLAVHVLSAQDFLSAPGSNPKLFKPQHELNKEKSRVFEQGFIYQYDTLELPFIDDFSRNHFPERVTDTSDERLRDTIVYAILESDTVVVDTFGFTRDSTFTYLLAPGGDTLSVTPNQLRDILFTELDGSDLDYSAFSVFPAYHIVDSFGLKQDTIFLEKEFEQDTAVYYIVAPNANDFYTNRSVYLNNTFAIDPPSIGVVTFDGLDEFGMPYDFDNELTVRADAMTSVPINLGNLPDTNVYFSFFYEPKGLSIDKLEVEDSLVLEFYDADKKRWGNIWRTAGFNEDSTFIQLNLLVPRKFHQNGFQFRFRNYASSTGAFDQWHVDYIYLNNGRSPGDTTYKDIAYVYDAPSLLKDYTAMPWFHYINNPIDYMSDTAKTRVTNNFDDDLSVFNKLVIPDTINGTELYRFPTNPNAFVVFPEEFTANFTYPLNGFFFPRTAIDSAGTMISTYDVDFRPSPSQEKDFIRSNDTVYSKTILENYYAYDDGTAEAGYGVVPQISSNGRVAYMAVEFTTPFPDTLQGMSMYFLPQEEDISKQTFVLTVWSSLNPATVIYEKTITNNPVYSDDNAFLFYAFDSAVVVRDKFFVGMKMIGRRSLNVGYDLNLNSKSKIFWSQNGSTWFSPTAGIRDGSLMIRPLFRENRKGVGLHKIAGSRTVTEASLSIYPNPVSDNLNIEFVSNEKMIGLEVMDVSGRLVYRENSSAFETAQRSEESYRYRHNLNISALKNGIYLLFIKEENGKIHSKKFIVQH